MLDMVADRHLLSSEWVEDISPPPHSFPMKKLFTCLAVAAPSPLAVSTQAACKQKTGGFIHPECDLGFVSKERCSV
jgi:hypothetical protein